MMLKAVIFDHSVLFVNDQKRMQEIRAVIRELKRHGLLIGVFSTDPINITALCVQFDYLHPDLTLTKNDVGSNKGSKEWMNTAAARLKVDKNQLLFVGDEKRDCITALNGPTFYLHAAWTGRRLLDLTALVAEKPSDVLLLVTHFLLPAPRWEHATNAPLDGLHVRSLLGAGTRLAATTPTTYTPLDVLRDLKNVAIGAVDAVEYLGLHVLSSLNNEGLIAPNSYFTCYPSSKRNKNNPVLTTLIQVQSKLLHGYYKQDILLRAVDAINTSDERMNAKREGRTANVSFFTQANSVHVNPKYKGKLGSRTIFVFDDFTTSGMSLD